VKNVVLTGFMGTGKTTIGRLLADQLGYEFVDVDAEIEKRTDRSPATWIREDGEARFREVEREVVSAVSEGSGRVVATGGGSLIDTRTRTLFDSTWFRFCLTCTPAEIMERVRAGGDRPLLADLSLDRISALLASRRSTYAGWPEVETSGRSPEEVVEEILARVGRPIIRFDQRTSSRVVIERGCSLDAGRVLSEDGVRGRVLVASDENVAAAGHSSSVAASLEAGGFSVTSWVLPAGETTKSVPCLEHLYRCAVESSLERSDTVVAVGGGVICDLAGFMAATYMRGVALVLIPTSLLAQVDASIGGKVGIDVGDAKNLAGAFYPAQRVLIDPDLLRTLEMPQIRQGLAEVVKTAMIRSETLWREVSALESPEQVLARDDIVRDTAGEKARLVSQDPYDRSDRALLNFGHTIGHAVEAASAFRLSHGGAISVGMTSELALAIEQGQAPQDLLPALTQTLSRFNLPLTAPDLNVDDVVRLVAHDKKRAGGVTRFAVPDRLGHGHLIPISQDHLYRAARIATGGQA
jgi:shikimate kinase/3-dehydroquinate synthase